MNHFIIFSKFFISYGLAHNYVQLSTKHYTKTWKLLLYWWHPHLHIVSNESHKKIVNMTTRQGSSNDKLGMEIANDNTTTINLPLSLKLITSIIVCLFPKSNPCCIINFLLDSDYLIFMNPDLRGFFFFK